MKFILMLPLFALFLLSGCSSTETKEKVPVEEKPAVEIKDSVYLDSSFEVVNKTHPDKTEIKSTNNIWTVAPKSTLKKVLGEWAKRANWSVSYETEAIVELHNKQPVDLYAQSIDGAAVELSKTLNLRAKSLFVVPYSGNKVIRVFTKGEKQ